MKGSVPMLRRRTLAGAVLALATVLSACERTVHEPQADPQPLTQRYDGPAGLVQTIRIADTHPATGETLRIESVITNEGAGPVAVTSSICGLHLETGLRFVPAIRCAGYSMGGTLSPGGSRVEVEEAVIASGPGTYSVRLRHLLDPEQWVSFQITVRGR
ncbi:MAG TPA: hypothetical protein VEQ60_27775 [Longimicrobium sp.]|nr:hypothetical protein [Longimicrobium sp.]